MLTSIFKSFSFVTLFIMAAVLLVVAVYLSYVVALVLLLSGLGFIAYTVLEHLRMRD